MPPKGTFWRVSEETFRNMDKDGRVWWGVSGNSIPRVKKFLSEAKQGVVPATLWFHQDVGTNAEAKIEIRKLFEDSEVELFTTPKPEKLLNRIIQLATEEGDVVLDSFAGSGTTGAVAHKMGRKWIMVELGEHCHTHIIPRLQKVIDDEDEGGITASTDWKGGGGFRYYELASSLLEQDRWGRWVVSKGYDAAMLAEAICKLEGFTYAPSDTVWWNHGYSTEQDRIFVTTQTLSVEQLTALSDELPEGISVLVCRSAFRCKADRFENLTLKKIPKMVLSRCEYGRDDYSLNVENLPMQEKPATDPAQASLFGDDD